MITANIHEAETNLSKRLEAVERGEEVIVARAGKPVAKLVAVPERKEPRKGGFWAGQAWMASDDEMKEVAEEIARHFNESTLDR